MKIQKMEVDTPTETTVSTESRELTHDAQSMIDWYINEILDFVIDHPFVSIPEIFQHIAHAGPCATPKKVLHLLGGPRQFKRICRRMEGLRWASIKNCLERFPLDPESESEETIRNNLRMNVRDEYLDWWAPNIRSAEPFLEELPEMEGVVARYPALIDTDDYFSSDEQSIQTDTEVNGEEMNISE